MDMQLFERYSIMPVPIHTGACLKFVTWTDKSLCLMGCSIFPLLLLSSSLDSLGHSVPPV